MLFEIFLIALLVTLVAVYCYAPVPIKGVHMAAAVVEAAKLTQVPVPDIVMTDSQEPPPAKVVNPFVSILYWRTESDGKLTECLHIKLRRWPGFSWLRFEDGRLEHWNINGLPQDHPGLDARTEFCVNQVLGAVRLSVRPAVPAQALGTVKEGDTPIRPQDSDKTALSAV